jgi:hypothetical protein
MRGETPWLVVKIFLDERMDGQDSLRRIHKFL